jgi:hypothetical protein
LTAQMMHKPDTIRGALLAGILAALALAATGASGESLVGALKVVTEPEGAVVHVAGRRVGISPCEIRDVGIGLVEVTAEKEGFETARQEVTVSAEGITQVRLKLARLENVGHIVVEVEPEGSVVEIDRVVRGETPLRVINLKAGTHRLKVTHADYRPVVVNVMVAKDKDNLVSGRLEKIVLDVGREKGPVEPEDIVDPVRSPKDAPSVEDMPEAMAFDPVRKLLALRRYQDALELLDEMVGREDMKPYMARVARDRVYARRAREVVEAGYEGLKAQVGKKHALLLTGGIAVTGTVLGMGEGDMTVDINGDGLGQPMPLTRLHIDRVIKLSARAFPPAAPANQTRFAVLYAMEGAYAEAYGALRRAAEAGHNVLQARSYVDSERLWQAALERRKQEGIKAAEEEERKRRAAAAERSAKKAVILIGRLRGGEISSALRSLLEDNGFELREARGPLTKAQLIPAAVLLVSDPGLAHAARPYDRQTVRLVDGFVRSGGGLLVIGGNRLRRRDGRPVPVAPPHNALLGQFRLRLRPDSIEPVPGAPRNGLRSGFPAGAVGRHPVLTGIDWCAFPRASCTIESVPDGWLLIADPSERSAIGTPPPPVVAAFARAGRGRVVVFGGTPDLAYEEAPRRRPGRRLLLNTLRWLAAPKAGRRPAK